MSRARLLPALSLVGSAAVALLVLLAYAAWGPGRAERMEVFGDAPTCALTDQLERPARSEDFRGKVMIANFVYTTCPDICPLLSFWMQRLQDRLRQEGLLGSRVQLLSFTVDPARDTPPVLRAYAERHQADSDAWRFLTGPSDEVVPLIVQGFRLGVQALPPTRTGRESGGDGSHDAYEVMHSGRFVLIDRRWRIRAYYDGREIDVEQTVRDVRELLR